MINSLTSICYVPVHIRLLKKLGYLQLISPRMNLRHLQGVTGFGFVLKAVISQTYQNSAFFVCSGEIGALLINI